MRLITRSTTSKSLRSSHNRPPPSKSNLQLYQYASKPTASGNAATAMQGPVPSKEGMLHRYASTGKMSKLQQLTSQTKGLGNPQSSQPSARPAAAPHLPTTSTILPYPAIPLHQVNATSRQYCHTQGIVVNHRSSSHRGSRLLTTAKGSQPHALTQCQPLQERYATKLFSQLPCSQSNSTRPFLTAQQNANASLGLTQGHPLDT